jgi:hypothetical protein
VVLVVMVSGPCSRGDSVDEVVTVLVSSGAEAKRRALQSLVRDGHAPDRVMAAVAKATTDPDSMVRRSAVFTLARLDSGRGDFRAALSRSTRDLDAEVRGLAALGLGGYLVRREEGVPVLEGLLRDDQEGTVREAAADALGNLGASASGAVDVLLEVARLGRPSLRISCAVAIRKIAPERLPKDMEADAVGVGLPQESGTRKAGR